MKHTHSILLSLSAVLCLAAAPAPAADEPSASRAARSVHLWWDASDGDLFYNEATIQESVPGSYFMACGWNTGYFGIQELGRGRKLVIFSVWDPTRGDNPNAVPDEQRVEVLHQDPDVQVSRFGGEGTGGKSLFDFDWQNGQAYRLMVRGEVQGEKTAYSGYFFLPGENRWKHLVTFRTRTGGQPLKGYYSFVEDFRRDGRSPHEVRRALFGHGWVRSLDGRWNALTKATFTADRTPLDNINAVLDGDRFSLATGGETKNTTPLRSNLERAPLDVPLPDFP